jgi:Tol biopolymer transport system component
MTYLRILTIALLPLLYASSCGQDKPDRLIDIDPPPDYSAIDEHASWSEAHELIAFMHNHQEDLNDPDSSGIYVINPDGTGKTLFLSVGLVFGIDWSPDGQWIVANVGSELWKISYPDAVVETLLTDGQYYYPSWSPDGTNISYAARAGDDRGVYLIGNDGANQRLIVPFGDYPAWIYPDSVLYMNYSPDFPSGSFCVCDGDGQHSRLFKNAEEYDVWGFTYGKVHMESGRIVCVPGIPGTQIDIWALPGEDAEFRLLVQKGEYPEFSPDGSQIVFTRYGSPYANLWIINWDGTGLGELTESLYD